VGSSLGRIKLKTIKLVFAASLLSTTLMSKKGAWHSPKIGYKRCLLLFSEIIVSFTL
jgi:hypothetical protein